MTAATGPQAAFLLLAFAFFSMLVSRSVAEWLGLPGEDHVLLGQVVDFAAGILVLAGIPALRKTCREQLRTPIPSGTLPELALVTLGKLAVPFAMIGAAALWNLSRGSVPDLQMTPEQVAQGWRSFLTPAGLFTTIALSWLIGPIVEELVFRGILYRAFERQWGWLAATAATALVFGIFHPTRIVAAAIGSVFLACVLRRTGSLRACILVHVTYNVAVSWPLLGRALHTSALGDPGVLASWTPYLASLAVLVLALPAYLLLSRSEVVARQPGRPAA